MKKTNISSFTLKEQRIRDEAIAQVEAKKEAERNTSTIDNFFNIATASSSILQTFRNEKHFSDSRQADPDPEFEVTFDHYENAKDNGIDRRYFEELLDSKSEEEFNSKMKIAKDLTESTRQSSLAMNGFEKFAATFGGTMVEPWTLVPMATPFKALSSAGMGYKAATTATMGATAIGTESLREEKLGQNRTESQFAFDSTVGFLLETGLSSFLLRNKNAQLSKDSVIDEKVTSQFSKEPIASIGYKPTVRELEDVPAVTLDVDKDAVNVLNVRGATPESTDRTIKMDFENVEDMNYANVKDLSRRIDLAPMNNPFFKPYYKNLYAFRDTQKALPRTTSDFNSRLDYTMKHFDDIRNIYKENQTGIFGKTIMDKANKAFEQSKIIKDSGRLLPMRTSFDETNVIVSHLDNNLRQVAIKNLEDANFEPQMLSAFKQVDDMSKMLTNIEDSVSALRGENKLKAFEFLNTFKTDVSSFLENFKKQKGITLDVKTRIDEISEVLKTRIDNGVLSGADGKAIKSVREKIDSLKKNPVVARLYDDLDKTKLEKYDGFIENNKKRIESIKNSNRIKKADKPARIKELEAKNKKHENARQKELKALADKKINELSKGLGSTELEIRKTKDGFKLGNKKLPTAIALALLGATAANADDFSAGDAIGGLATLLIAGALGVGGIKALKNSGIISKTSEYFRGANKSTSGSLKRKGDLKRDVRNAVDEGFPALRKLTNTPERLADEFRKFGDKEIAEIFDSLAFNPLKNTTGDSFAEVSSMQRYQSNMAEVFKELKVNLDGWRKENGISYWDYVKSKVTDDSIFQSFMQDVAHYTDGAGTPSKAGSKYAQAQAKAYMKAKQDVLERAKQNGVDAADIEALDNYLTRSYNTAFSDAVKAMDERSLFEVKGVFADMYRSAIKSSDVAPRTFEKLKSMDDLDKIKKYISETKTFKRIRDDFSFMQAVPDAFKRLDGAKSADEAKGVLRELEALLGDAKTDKVIDEYFKNFTRVGGEVEMASDIFGSLKNRIPLDLTKFRDVDVRLTDGTTYRMNLETVFDRNVHSLTDAYVKNFEARNSLAKKGYQYEYAKDKIKESKLSDTQKEEAMAVFNSYSGVPNYNPVGFASEAGLVASNVLYTSSMTLVASTFLYEAFKFTARGVLNAPEVSKSVKHMIDFAVSSGDDSFLNQLIKNTGQGTDRLRQTTGFRGQETLYNDAVDTRSSIVNATTAARNAVFRMPVVGLHALGDFFQRLNMAYSAEKLIDWANGGRMSKVYEDALGLKESDRALIKKAFTRNKNGFAKEYKFKEMSEAEQDRVNGFLFSLNQDGAQVSTIGTSPVSSYQSELGSTATKLFSWVLNSWSNQGLRMFKGVAQGDPEQAMMLISSVVGSYAAVRTRDAINGIERDEEEAIKYAVLGSPVLAPAVIGESVATGELPIFSYAGN